MNIYIKVRVNSGGGSGLSGVAPQPGVVVQGCLQSCSGKTSLVTKGEAPHVPALGGG
jgi:hypothetical protein